MIESNLLSQSLKIELKFKYTPWFFIVDQTVRFVLLIMYLQEYFPTSSFVFFQYTILLILILFYNYYKNKLKEKYSPCINKKYEDESPEITIQEEIPGGLFIYQILFGFIFSFWFFFHTFESHSWYVFIIIFLFSIVSACICVLPLILTIRYRESLGIISATPKLLKNIKDPNNLTDVVFEDVSAKFPDIFISDKLIGFGTIHLDPVDLNDTKIAKLESEMKNINYRSEAWILESVFLGGLAFSGFLTVASANFLGKEPVVFNEFILHFKNYFDKCFKNEIISWFIQIENSFSRNDLYILIMLLCLLSSVFFLLVLILRLRLNSLSLNMDHLIRILNIFNAKEEELFNLKLEKGNEEYQLHRLEKIEKKIDTALIDADNLLKELQPTSIMMNTYRTIAVFLFYVVLILSGFYFMPFIAILILSLFLFTQIFGYFQKYSKIERIRNLIKKH